jgi:YHS domain-containing protein
VPAGISGPYGSPANSTASPAMAQQPPPVMQQQPPLMPPQNQDRVAVAPPQNNLAPPPVAGNPPFGLDGCCPVSLGEKGQWVAGDRRWGMNHRGRLYFFAGPEEQRRFFADPDRYAPVVSGNDIVLAGEGQVVSGRREYGVYYRNHVYLFCSEATRARFEANPAPYANQALQALRAGAYHPAAQWR